MFHVVRHDFSFRGRLGRGPENFTFDNGWRMHNSFRQLILWPYGTRLFGLHDKCTSFYICLRFLRDTVFIILAMRFFFKFKLNSL